MDFCKRLSRGIERVSIVFGGFLLMLNVADVLMGIAMRTFLGAAPIWTEELARFTMIWMVLIGAAAAFYSGDQMSIDFVAMQMPPRGKAFCGALSVLVQTAVLGALVWFGSLNVLGSWKMKTMALGVPKSIPLMAVPVGMAMLLAAVLLNSLRHGRGGSE